MLEQLIALCGSAQGLGIMLLVADVAIAAAYFAIPISMAVVLRHRRLDIAYPWLWSLFVAFIVACGLTHLGHAWGAVAGTPNLLLQATLGLVCAAISVGTAIAFAFVLPSIKSLPSPRQHTIELERMVAERTAEKDRLIREINHRVGNQLQVLSSQVSIEIRKAVADETTDALVRIQATLDEMAERHTLLRQRDYLT